MIKSMHDPMQIELAAEQKIALETQHSQCRDCHGYDKIQCVRLSAQNWSTAMITQSMETTVP
ncbi:hypothetical protein ABLB69_06990 [Xenorhabdus khoisanae]|uniref:hypothetical protein n=1 Tax=Xenorhabdus khoisanae TaxID=880157 RepID=UPI0032B87AB9